MALLGYSRLFKAIGDDEYCRKCLDLSIELRDGVNRHFMMEHPRYGQVYTDTTDDCWTYEYKRMVDLLIFSDLYGYDMQGIDPDWFGLMSRTYDAEKEVYFDPCSARQMGYGQGYITQAALMLDRYDDFTNCVNAAADMCYHHSDWPYIVPEGIIVHGSKRFWFRNSDLGNAVQQAEIVKCARLIAGIDDILPERGVKLVPRLPNNWKSIDIKNFTAALPGGNHGTIDFYYSRLATDDSNQKDIEKKYKYSVTVQDDSGTGYLACWNSDFEISSLRTGPFKTLKISINNGKIRSVKRVSGNYFVEINDIQENVNA